MIRREYLILIIGGALFVAGIIVATIWAIPFASTFLQENTLINQVSIEPGRSAEETTQVTDVSRPITVVILVERPEEGGKAEEEEDGQQQQVSQREQPVLTLVETVKDPSRLL
jgi:FtsZ-interacting cell division protein ZipA